MSMPTLLRTIVLGLIASLLAPAALAGGMSEARDSLLENSPFVSYSPPQNTVTPPPPPPPGPGPLSREINYNGMLNIGEETFFSIFDKSLNQSLLLGLNETGARFTIIGYDETGERSIQVKSGSRVERITMVASDGAPIPTAAVAPNTAVQSRNAQQQLEQIRSGTNVRQTPTVPRRRIIPRRRTPAQGAEQDD